MAKILVIDDNQQILNFLKIFLIQAGENRVETLQDSTKAYDILEKDVYEILLLDMDMPNVTGLDILKWIKEKKLNIITIVITGVEDIDLAISAMKLGTNDYLLKPIDEKKLLEALDNAINKINLNLQFETPESELYERLKHKDAFKKIITQDAKMHKIFHFAEKYAITDNSVLIWGESGTGKELIAEAIHKISTRKDKGFVAVNAGLFAHELFESEFFGHEKGAFTGAIKDKKGFIEEANGGTLFLDEIGELDLLTQVKLLRVLQEQEFYRLGSTKNIKVDVRIIAATNKNLFEEINLGNFRKDLFFRLNINSIELPPLRERANDIELLSEYFLQKFNKKYNKNVKKISNAVMTILKDYSYPGNIRELMNIINSAIIVESGSELRKQSLPNYFWENHQPQHEPAYDFVPSSLEEIEKEHIKRILDYTKMNKTKAAELLGISRVNLIAKVKKYGL
jgi:DNA-binding NtrC family response regulator